MDKSRDPTSDADSSLIPVVTDDDRKWILKQADPINQTVSRYILTNPGLIKVSKFYPGIGLAGKGYTMTSLQNFVNRYYTIANCMN